MDGSPRGVTTGVKEVGTWEVPEVNSRCTTIEPKETEGLQELSKAQGIPLG